MTMNNVWPRRGTIAESLYNLLKQPTEFDWNLIFSKMDNDENKTRVQIRRWCEDKLIKKTGRGKKAKFKKI